MHELLALALRRTDDVCPQLGLRFAESSAAAVTGGGRFVGPGGDHWVRPFHGTPAVAAQLRSPHEPASAGMRRS
jgi:hypothetical protein